MTTPNQTTLPAVTRPLAYTPAWGAYICGEIAGGKTLRRICTQASMPTMGTVREWLEAHADFRAGYTRAREVVADRFAVQILAIADDSDDDYLVQETPAGKVLVFNRENVQRAKLRIDVRKWMMTALGPHTYGHMAAREVETEEEDFTVTQYSSQTRRSRR